MHFQSASPSSPEFPIDLCAGHNGFATREVSETAVISPTPD